MACGFLLQHEKKLPAATKYKEPFLFLEPSQQFRVLLQRGAAQLVFCLESVYKSGLEGFAGRVQVRRFGKHNNNKSLAITHVRCFGRVSGLSWRST